MQCRRSGTHLVLLGVTSASGPATSPSGQQQSPQADCASSLGFTAVASVAGAGDGLGMHSDQSRCQITPRLLSGSSHRLRAERPYA
mmetsp:Transcript_12238/g.36771  ORF Transcript_12238/g.36771 Transcript_12238/m.36771 type:complete len:86 (+) Transcript_12238:8678-8935(+)